MKKFLKNFIFNYFGSGFYVFLRELLFSIKKKNVGYLFYNTLSDLNFNENLIKNNGYDIGFIKDKLKENNLDYFDKNLSWHYHIFAGISKNSYQLKILEIGTSTGEFTNYLANIFSDSKITSIDLSDENREFVLGSNKDSDAKEKIIKIMKKNISHKNVKFIEMDSINLVKNFSNETFDLIWIDGDHLDPQATIDIYSSFNLLKKDGLMLCDDIIKHKHIGRYTSNETFKTLSFFENKNLIKNLFFVKRCYKQNSIRKKYISMSKKI